MKFQLSEHFLHKVCNGKPWSHFILNKNRCWLIVHFFLLTFTYWTSLCTKTASSILIFWKFLKNFTQKIKFWESKTGLFKGKKISSKCSYTAGNVLGKSIAACYISSETELLSRQNSSVVQPSSSEKKLKNSSNHKLHFYFKQHLDTLSIWRAHKSKDYSLIGQWNNATALVNST